MCPDPVCNHRDGSGCFFNRNFYIHEIKDDIIYYTGCYKESEIKGLGSKYDENGNYVGYTKDDFYATYLHPFYAFNMKTGEREFLFEFHSASSFESVFGDSIIAITDDKIIYGELSFEYETVDDEELMYYVANIGCCDRKSKKTERLFEYDRTRYEDGKPVYSSTGMAPYLYDEETNTMFFLKKVPFTNYYSDYATYAASLDDESLNFKEIYSKGKIVCITEDGNYIAEKMVERDSIFTNYDLILIDAETGEETVLLGDFLFSEYAFCGDYVMNVPFKYNYYTDRDGKKRGSKEFGDDLVLVNYKTLEKITIPIANAFKDSTYSYAGPGISPNFYRGRVIYRYNKNLYNEYGENIPPYGYSDIMLDYATGKYIVFNEDEAVYQ